MRAKFAWSIIGLLVAVGLVGGTTVYYKILHPEKVVKEQERPHFRRGMNGQGTQAPTGTFTGQ